MVEALHQLGTGVDEVAQVLAQLRRDAFLRLLGEQVVHVSLRVGQLIAFLIELELVQAQVGDLVGQFLVGLDLRQRLLLLVEDLRQQQAATQHVDLLVEGLVELGQAVELLLGFQVAPGQLVEAVGGPQQIIREAQVGGVFLAQQAVAAGALAAVLGQLGDRLLRLLAALVADHGLQFEGLVLGAGDLLAEQVAAAVGEVLQQVVAGQLLAQQLDLGVQRVLLGEQLVAPFRRDRLAGFLAGFQRVADLQHARLEVADVGLGALRAGLRGDELALGVEQLLLPVGQLGGAVVEQQLQAADVLPGVALGRGFVRGAFQARQVALVLEDQPRRVGQAGLEFVELLQAVVARAEQLERALQAGLGGLHVGVRQLARGQAVEALLDVVGGRRLVAVGVHRHSGEGAAQEEGGEQGAQEGRHGRGRRFSIGCSERSVRLAAAARQGDGLPFDRRGARGRAPDRDDLRGI